MRLTTLSMPVAALVFVAACGEDTTTPAPVLEQEQAQLVAGAPAAEVPTLAGVDEGVMLDSAAVTVAATPAIEAPRLAEVARLPVAETIGAVGLRIAEVDGAFVVNEALADMPAAEAGLEAGDVVVAVDGMEAGAMSLDQFIDLVRGAPGESVTLTIVAGADERDVTIERGALTIERDRCERIQDMARDTEFGGIGVRLSMESGCNGAVYVRSVEAGMPAEAAGLSAGDRIVSVDGLDAAGAHVWDVVDVMRGEPGSVVVVGVEDTQGVARTVELERVSIAMPEGGGCR